VTTCQCITDTEYSGCCSHSRLSQSPTCALASSLRARFRIFISVSWMCVWDQQRLMIELCYYFGAWVFGDKAPDFRLLFLAPGAGCLTNRKYLAWFERQKELLKTSRYEAVLKTVGYFQKIRKLLIHIQLASIIIMLFPTGLLNSETCLN
jgi:hypothetical protein